MTHLPLPGQLGDQVGLALASAVVGDPVQISHGGPDAGVAEIVLQVRQCQSGLQLVGGVGVPIGLVTVPMNRRRRGSTTAIIRSSIRR